MRGRKIRGGCASSEAVVCSSPVSFLGGVDTTSGKLADVEEDAKGLSIADKVFCFPFGKGSTVGSYAMYQLRLNELAPAAIINDSAEPIIATGAIIADIPMVDGIETELLRTGDHLDVDADSGEVELVGVKDRHVVTSIMRNKRKILLLQRSDKVGSYRGRWAGVSGYMEKGEDDVSAAKREIEEEIGHRSVHLAKHAETIRFRDGDVVWSVHPFLFDVKVPSIKIDWEHRSFEWISPYDVKRFNTVPGLQKVVQKLL